MSIQLLLMIVALVCFLLATIPIASRINLLALGLLFCVLAWLIPSLR